MNQKMIKRLDISEGVIYLRDTQVCGKGKIHLIVAQNYLKMFESLGVRILKRTKLF